LKKKSLISICIPNYNNAKYLEKCIQSALNINYENKEREEQKKFDRIKTIY